MSAFTFQHRGNTQPRTSSSDVASVPVLVGAPAVEIVIPVYNEQQILERSVRRLHAHLSRQLDLSFRITIADNASTDATLERARALADELDGVRVLHLDPEGPRPRAARCLASKRGRGRGLHGRRSLDRLAALSELLGPCWRSVATSRSARAGARRPRHARGQARADFARLQPPAADGARRHVLGRPVWLQGRSARGDRAAARPGRVRRVVLRHRAAVSRAAQQTRDPRGSRALGGRPRLARDRSSPPPAKTCAA